MTSESRRRRTIPGRTSGPKGMKGLDELFSWFGGMVEQLEEMIETGEDEIHRTGEFKVRGLGEKARGVYGVRVRMGLGGETQVQPFGNIKPTEKGPEVV
mgnify:CR=1 FL=1